MWHGGVLIIHVIVIGRHVKQIKQLQLHFNSSDIELEIFLQFLWAVVQAV